MILQTPFIMETPPKNVFFKNQINQGTVPLFYRIKIYTLHLNKFHPILIYHLFKDLRIIWAGPINFIYKGKIRCSHIRKQPNDSVGLCLYPFKRRNYKY